MIARIRGEVVDAMPNRLVIDVNGVGYDVLIPVTTFDRINPKVGDQAALLTYLHVREQALTLYGFAAEEDRDLFRLLIDRVSGIGPSIAMAVLSGMQAAEFKGAVVNGDATSLSKIKGLGKKTAERIILELKDKVGVAETWQATKAGEVSSTAGDAEMALIALGFKQVEARKTIRKVLDATPGSTTEDLIRESLRMMN